MTAAHTQNPFLTTEQVQQLNDRHGWFEFGDAQSDVSRAFAQDAIAMHERIRAAAPELLEALKLMSSLPGFEDEEPYAAIVRAAIKKAEGV